MRVVPKRLFVQGGICLLVLGVLGAVLAEWRIRSANLPEALFSAPPATPAITDLRGRPIFLPPTDFARDSRPAPLADFGQWLPYATVAIEDRRFYEHAGLDFSAMAGASLRNFLGGRIISGASTITQQTIKLGNGRTRRTFDAKWREAFAALRLERAWPKQKILETYLNRLDYGNRRIGPRAAAFAYFGKEPADLTFAEAVFLAGLPQSPSRLNPWRNPANALARYRRNVERMTRQGLLPSGISASELLKNPPTPGVFEPPASAPLFARDLVETLRATGGSIRSTLDLETQVLVEDILRRARKELASLGASACAAVVLENATGGVRAMASTSLPSHSQINLATSLRSAGSTLKPFLYAEGIDRRLFTAATLLPDTEEAIRDVYGDYDPRNYNHRFLGPVRVREALGNSLNVPAVIALEKIGAREFYDKLRVWGFQFGSSFDEVGAGFILGNTGISLLDLAGAYASLARGGESWHPVRFIGEPVAPSRCVSRETADIITDILADDNARRTSFGAGSPLSVGTRVAVKTGTSSGFRDGWCVGFTNEHTVAVWAGNPDGSPMDSALAVHSAAPTWHAIIRALLEAGDSPLPELQASDRLETRQVASASGLLPRAGEASVREWFLAGTAPAVDSSSASTLVDGEERLLLSAEYSGWCRSPQNRIGAVARAKHLEILFPKNGAVFVFNPHLSPARQILVPKSSDPGCEWWLDGRKLPAPAIPLRPGFYTLTAVSGDEKSVANLTVE